VSSQRFVCAECGESYGLSEIRYRCDCGAPLDIEYTREPGETASKELFDARLGTSQQPYNSGVWRYRELLPSFANGNIVSRPEGNTNLYSSGADQQGGLRRIGQYAGIQRLFVKHEGENPTGSFKDRGMTVGVSQARAVGARAVACASTGNTSSSLASYAAQADIPCFVFVPEGKISSGKLSQTLAYGASTLQIEGDFDAAMRLVQEVCDTLGVYLVNSVNPFRIEGQKTIAFELLQQIGWEPPDWIVLPAGNLGNTSALGKALVEAHELGLISKMPRLASVQASGANPFYRSFVGGFEERYAMPADTLATAIKIGNPVSYERARRAILATRGVVTEASDAQILEAKAVIDRAGIGCEPASAASLAGAKKLVQEGIIRHDETVALVLTGHLLKDADTTFGYHMGDLGLPATGTHANRPVRVGATLDAVREAVEARL
jgi:threonine synthase